MAEENEGILAYLQRMMTKLMHSSSSDTGFSKVSDPYLSDMVIDSIVRIFSQGSKLGDNPNLWEILKSGVDQAPKLELLLATYSRSLDRRVGISHEVKTNLFIKYALMNKLLAEFCRMLVQNEQLLKKSYFPTSIVLSSEHHSMFILQLTTLECLDFTEVWSEQGGAEKEEEEGPQKTLVLTASSSSIRSSSMNTSSADSGVSADESQVKTTDSLHPKAFTSSDVFTFHQEPFNKASSTANDSNKNGSNKNGSNKNDSTSPSSNSSTLSKGSLASSQTQPREVAQNSNPIQSEPSSSSDKNLFNFNLSSTIRPSSSDLSSSLSSSSEQSTLSSTIRPTSDISPERSSSSHPSSSLPSSSLFSASTEPSFKFTSIYSKTREESSDENLTPKLFSTSSSTSHTFLPTAPPSNQTPATINSNPAVGTEANPSTARNSSAPHPSSLETSSPPPTTTPDANRRSMKEMIRQSSSRPTEGPTKKEPQFPDTSPNPSQASPKLSQTSPNPSQTSPNPSVKPISDLAIAAEVEAPPLVVEHDKGTELTTGHPPPPGSAKKRAKKRTIDL